MEVENSSHGGTELAEAVNRAYRCGQTDYSIEPLILADQAGVPIGRIKDGDSVIFCLRRGEREVQLTEAFVDPQAVDFPRLNFVHLPFIILTLYHEKFKDLPVAFAPTKVKDTLSEILSQAKLKQLHISESEKYAHVTFFFNGGNNRPFEYETDVRIPSPRGVPADQNPELSLPLVADSVIQAVEAGYDFIVVNFANCDVIGHTSDHQAKLKCAEYVDIHLGRVVEAALKSGYYVLVTADHGNLEAMVNSDGTPNVSHTTNPVPFVLVAPGEGISNPIHPGSLADVAPTILSLYGLPQPAAMTGRSLLDGQLKEPAQRVLLLILDGWGIGEANENNPIFLAHTPCWDDLLARYPNTMLEAAGEAVGLKVGKNGNSEAGHMNLGAGRLVWQDDVRLDHAMLDGSFYNNEIFLQAIEDVKQHRSALHLISLLSEKSSHGSLDYPLALLRMAKDHDLSEVYLHVIFDGRSTEPGSAPALLAKFDRRIAEIGVGQIVTGMGRGIALDRDGDYHKTRCAYEALVFGIGKKYAA